MKKVALIFLTSIWLMFSCKRTTDKVIYTPPEFNKIQTKTVTVFGDTIDDIGSTPIIVDSFFISHHQSIRNEQLFHVYNRNTGKYVQSFGNKGRGFGELVSVTGISMDYTNKSMYVGALNQTRAAVFVLDSLGFGKIGVSEIKLKQPLSSTGFFRLKPHHYLTVYNAYNRFALYDNELNLLDTCDYYSPTVTGGTEGKALSNYYFYSSGIIIKPDGTKFANITYRGGILEIFSTRQNRIRHLTTSYFYQPVYNNKSGIPDWKKCIRGAAAHYATDKYIYILLNGTLDNDQPINKVSVFDWQGQPVKQYDLGVNIKDVIIDENSNRGYVIYRDDAYEYHWGKFDL